VPESSESFTVTLGTASVPQSAKGCKGITGAVNQTAKQTAVTITDSDIAFAVPDGWTAELRSISIGGCHDLEAFYDVDGARTEIADNLSTSTCGTAPIEPDAITVTNTSGSTQVVRLGIQDDSCTRTYLSDTTSLDENDVAATVNHATVAALTSRSWQVDLADAEVNCDTEDSYRSSDEFSAIVRIEPITRSGTFEIPVGQQATVDVTVAGCDTIVGYYETASGLTHIVDNAGSECTPASDSAVITNSSASDPLPFTIVLEDQNCTDGFNNMRYASDGTGTADHATAWATDPVSVDIADSGGGCGARWDQPFDTDFGDGNLHATVTFAPIP